MREIRGAMHNPIVFRCAKTVEKTIKPEMEKRNCAPFEAVGEYAGKFYLSFCSILDAPKAERKTTAASQNRKSARIAGEVAPNRADVYLGTRLGKSLDAVITAELAVLGKKMRLDAREATDRFAGGADIEEARLAGVQAVQFAVNENALGKIAEYAGAAADFLISRVAPSEVAAFNRKIIRNSLVALEKDANALLEAQKGGARLQALLGKIAEEKSAAAGMPDREIDAHLEKAVGLRKVLASLQSQAREREFRSERQHLEEERRRIIADLADLEKMRGGMDPDVYVAEKEGLEFMLKEVERIIAEKKKK